MGLRRSLRVDGIGCWKRAFGAAHSELPHRGGGRLPLLCMISVYCLFVWCFRQSPPQAPDPAPSPLRPPPHPNPPRTLFPPPLPLPSFAAPLSFKFHRNAPPSPTLLLFPTLSRFLSPTRTTTPHQSPRSFQSRHTPPSPALTPPQPPPPISRSPTVGPVSAH